MGMNTTSTYSDAIQGVPGVGVTKDIRDQHTTPRFNLGYVLEKSDGSRYRYSHFATAVAQGLLASQDVSESSVALNTWTTVVPASTVSGVDGNSDTFFIEATASGVFASQFKGAKLLISNNTGEGYLYTIEDNTATDDPASGNIRIKLTEKIVTTLSASSDLVVQGSKFGNLEVANDATDDILAGVTVRSMSANRWGWVQTRGPAAVLQSNTMAIGDITSLAVDIDGAAERMFQVGTVAGSSDRPALGPVLGIDISTGFCIVDMGLE